MPLLRLRRFEAFRRARLTVDHLKSVKRGGDSNDNNLVTCCATCNAEKGGEDLGSVEDVRRFLRLYRAECARPWFQYLRRAKGWD
jgi:5-methylcytosine-specific restriction endonuclease McrA